MSNRRIFISLKKALKNAGNYNEARIPKEADLKTKSNGNQKCITREASR